MSLANKNLGNDVYLFAESFPKTKPAPATRNRVAIAIGAEGDIYLLFSMSFLICSTSVNDINGILLDYYQLNCIFSVNQPKIWFCG